ncbi:MAG: sulfite exporter TauE/SafE family protein [Promethearchaeota archaeon]
MIKIYELYFLIIIGLIAFICEYIDSSLGGGYGTILTPILLILGFQPLQIVPSILFSEFCTGLFAAFYHQKLKNVNFDFQSDETKITLILSVCGVFGVIFAAFLSLNLPSFIVSLYISILILILGAFILIRGNRKFNFTYNKIVGIGVLSAFNKGISGGGYGPLVSSGQIITGVDEKKAIATGLFAEGIISIVGFLVYLFIKTKSPLTLTLKLNLVLDLSTLEITMKYVLTYSLDLTSLKPITTLLTTPIGLDLTLLPFIVIGAICSVPPAAITTQKIPNKILRKLIGILIIILGLISIIKIVYFS